MKRILVVDDDKTLRDVLTEYLQKEGYQVEDASSGAEGLKAFGKNPPDLVVSDVMMPEMDGLEFCRTLRSTPSGQLVPFIFLSGMDELDDRVRGHSMGADDYITKPFEIRELLAKIEVQLERSHRIHSEIIRMIQQVASNGGDGEAAAEPHTPPEPLPLTPAEERVFWEVIQGYTNKQISDRLFISPRTVQSHLSNILGKLQLDNRAQLVRFAYERGYREPSGQ